MAVNHRVQHVLDFVLFVHSPVVPTVLPVEHPVPQSSCRPNIEALWRAFAAVPAKFGAQATHQNVPSV